VILFSKKSVENPVKHKGTRGNRPSQKTKLEAAASSRADQLETSFRTERNPSAKKTTQNFPIPAFQSPRRVQQESSLSVENSISKTGRSKENNKNGITRRTENSIISKIVSVNQLQHTDKEISG
jgi:hypothetical protein